MGESEDWYNPAIKDFMVYARKYPHEHAIAVQYPGQCSRVLSAERSLPQTVDWNVRERFLGRVEGRDNS